MRLPELVQGIVLTVGSAAYQRYYRQNAVVYGYLDGGHYLGRICAAGGAGFTSIYMATLRAKVSDKLYNDYQTVLEGRKS